MSIQQFAKYPFLKEASQYLKEKGPTLEELLKDILYERVRTMGKTRVLEAVHEAEIKEHGFITEAECFIELLSYPMARIIVSAINDPYLTRRYALAEAVRANDRLKKEDEKFVLKFSSELGISTQSFGEKFVKIHFTDFLRNTSSLRSKEWKLVNQEMDSGYVILGKEKVIRLIQNALQMRFESELPIEVDKNVLKMINKDDILEVKIAMDKRRSAYKPEDFGRVSVIKLPPCIKHLLGKAQAGESISHHGRFALTAFLHTIGLSGEDILKIFSMCPDFDANKSRYQIEHITGVVSGTEYTPPECSTMKSYGICFEPDDLCKMEWITHPLKYYRVKGKRIKKE